MFLPPLIIKEIFDYLPLKCRLDMRFVSKEWNQILVDNFSLVLYPLNCSKEQLSQIGKYIKECIIADGISPSLLKDIAELCPNLLHLDLFEKQSSLELIQLLNAREVTHPVAKSLHFDFKGPNPFQGDSSTEFPMNSLTINPEVKRLIINLFYNRLGKDPGPILFEYKLPKLEFISVLELSKDIKFVHQDSFLRLRKIYLSFVVDHDLEQNEFSLPSIPTIEEAFVTFCVRDYENVKQEDMKKVCYLLLPSSQELPKLKAFGMSAQIFFLGLKPYPGTSHSVYPRVEALHFYGKLANPIKCLALFPSCQTLNADFSLFPDAEVSVSQLIKTLRLYCFPKALSGLTASFSNVTKLSISPNILNWVFDHVPNLKYLEICTLKVNMDSELSQAGAKAYFPESPKTLKRLPLLEWFYVFGPIHPKLIKEVLDVSPKLKAVCSDNITINRDFLKKYPGVEMYPFSFASVSKMNTICEFAFKDHLEFT